MNRKQYHKPNLTLAYLSDIAEVFDCHPRTILRAYEGNPTEYWAPKHNPRLRLSVVAERFQISKAQIALLLIDEEKVYPPAETAELLGISLRTLRAKAMYKPLITGAGFLRFGEKDIAKWHGILKAQRRAKINKLF